MAPTSKSRVVTRTVTLILALMVGMISLPARASAQLADDLVQIQSREAELGRAIHGARSAHGQVRADLQNLQNVRLRPVELRNGQFMLRAWDPASGRFLNESSLSHPTLKAQLRRLEGRRFVTPDDARFAARSHQGWLTRQANRLEMHYRGRIGGLEGQRGLVQERLAQASNPPAGNRSSRSRRPVRTRRTRTANPGGNGTTTTARTGTNGTSTTPRVRVRGRGVTTTASTGTIPNAPGTSASVAPQSSTVVKPPVTTRGSTTAVSTGRVTQVATQGPALPGTAPKTAASIQPGTVTAPAAATTARPGLASRFKGGLWPMISLALVAQGVASMSSQMKNNGAVNMDQTAADLTSRGFLGGLIGGVAGGVGGGMAINLLSKFTGPLSPLVGAAATIGGAMLGSYLGAGVGLDQIEWGRLAFNTAVMVGAAALIGTTGFLPLIGLTAAGFAADKIYDWIFSKDKKKARGAPQVSHADMTKPRQRMPAWSTRTGFAQGTSPMPPGVLPQVEKGASAPTATPAAPGTTPGASTTTATRTPPPAARTTLAAAPSGTPMPDATRTVRLRGAAPSGATQPSEDEFADIIRTTEITPVAAH